MLDELHEETDLREELTEKAEAIVERVMQDKLAEVVEESVDEEGQVDMEEVFSRLAELVEEELADLTTDAVHLGAAIAKKILAKAKL